MSSGTRRPVPVPKPRHSFAQRVVGCVRAIEPPRDERRLVVVDLFSKMPWMPPYCHSASDQDSTT
jgi:hypothetical protein